MRRPDLAVVLAAAALLAWAGAAACGRSPTAGGADAGLTLAHPTGQPVEFAVSGPGRDQPLLAQLAARVRARWPRVRLRATAEDRGTGLAALLAGKRHLLLVDHPFSPEEAGRLRRSGLALGATLLGVDPLAVVLHGDSALERLSLPAVNRILRGELRSWADLQGPDLPVVPYCPPGTGDASAWIGAPAEASALATGGVVRVVEEVDFLLESVRRTPGGIGLVPLAQLPLPAALPAGIKLAALTLKDGSAAAFPTERSAAERGTYPLVRPIVLLVRRSGDGAGLAALLRGPVIAQLCFELGLATAPPGVVESFKKGFTP